MSDFTVLDKSLTTKLWAFLDDRKQNEPSDMNSMSDALEIITELLRLTGFLTEEARNDPEFRRILDERLVKFKLQKE